MYKFERYRQLDLQISNQPVGFKMDPKTAGLRNRKRFRGTLIEEKYANCFRVKP